MLLLILTTDTDTTMLIRTLIQMLIVTTYANADTDTDTINNADTDTDADTNADTDTDDSVTGVDSATDEHGRRTCEIASMTRPCCTGR